MQHVGPACYLHRWSQNQTCAFALLARSVFIGRGRVQGFLEAHSNVHLYFTSTHSSWLNQVDLWFAKIERDLIYCGNFTTVKDFSERITTYIHRSK